MDIQMCCSKFSLLGELTFTIFLQGDSWMRWWQCSGPLPPDANILCRLLFKLSPSFFPLTAGHKELFMTPQSLSLLPMQLPCILLTCSSVIFSIPFLIDDGLLLCVPSLMAVQEWQPRAHQSWRHHDPVSTRIQCSFSRGEHGTVSKPCALDLLLVFARGSVQYPSFPQTLWIF